MSRPWLGSKGSWERKPKVSIKKQHDNFEKIFGKKLTWLQLKKIQESWLCSNNT